MPVKKLESPNEWWTIADTTGTSRLRLAISASMGPPLIPQTVSRTPRFRRPPRARPPVPDEMAMYGWRRLRARMKICPESPTVTGRPPIVASPPSPSLTSSIPSLKCWAGMKEPGSTRRSICSRSVGRAGLAVLAGLAALAGCGAADGWLMWSPGVSVPAGPAGQRAGGGPRRARGQRRAQVACHHAPGLARLDDLVDGQVGGHAVGLEADPELGGLGGEERRTFFLAELLDLRLEQHVGRDRRVHEPDLGSRPGQREVDLPVSVQDHEGQAEGLADDHADRGHGDQRHGVQQGHDPDDGPVPFGLGAYQEAGRVLQH